MKRFLLALGVTFLWQGCGEKVEPGLVADELFDPFKGGTFEIFVNDENFAKLNESPLDKVYVPATLSYNGKTDELAAIRYKGSYGTLESCVDEQGKQICPKLSFKLKFNLYDDDNRFAGFRKVNLHSSVRDPSMMHEVLGYSLHRRMGNPAPLANHIRVRLNGESLGVFILVESVDKEFVQDHFADDEGNLFKEVWPTRGDDDTYRAALKTNEDEGDVSAMKRFEEAILSATDENFEETMKPFIDSRALANFMAVDDAIGNYDGISQFYCFGRDSEECQNHNFYWYQEPSGKFNLIPWDLDYAFSTVNENLGQDRQDPNPNDCQTVWQCDLFNTTACREGDNNVYLLPAQCDPLLGMVHRATWKNDYAKALQTMLDGPIAEMQELHRAKTLQIEPWIEADPNHPGLAEFQQWNKWLEEHILAQKAAIEAVLSNMEE